ncbi:MAG TPA: hypothetical protein VGI40_09390 [Pirellulaceae bacterium]|jgi:hypothetical protein
MFGLRYSLLRALATLVIVHCAISCAAEPQRVSKVPTLDEVIASGHDLWGEAAMAQPNGASYEFFEPLLAPLRYVHADFRYYPLVLSAPRAKTKARLISNGSGVNLRGGSRSWKEVGTPIVFRVGPDEFRFGDLRERVSFPELAEGWLPIYSITYRHPSPSGPESMTPIDQQPTKKESETYRLEAFVSTDSAIAENAVVFVQFSLVAGAQGQVTVNVDPPGDSQFAKGAIKNETGETVALLDESWKWERQGAHAALTPGKTATLAIITKPLAENKLPFDAKAYDKHRELTVRHWKEIMGRAMNVELPEPRLNHAWKNLIAQNFMLANGDRMLYSAGNQYEALYEMEGSDAVLALLAWGYADEARELFVPLLDFTRKGLEAHQAGQKINDIVRYWWQTRDTPWVKEMRPRLEREFDRIVSNRNATTGLLPKERYCGDIATPVNSLSVEAKVVRALRDLPPVLRGIGDAEFADRVAKAEAEIRPKIMDAVMKSVRHDVSPPFVPIALLDKESIHDPITATRIGSYWNLIISYVTASRIFPPGSAEEKWIPAYLEQHGGLCMGMIRAGGAQNTFWTGPDRTNPLYGTRYALDTLRRDDPERALVSLYGMLAHGFTRNTLIAAEGNTLAPVDDGGRFFYCPPNSAGNAHFLSILRNLLVQDWDFDDDGEPETLRLLYGTSRRWLEDGKQIVVERAPTAFGPVSVRAESRLNTGQVVVSADLPSRNPAKRTMLRARVPDGWRVTSAKIDGKSLAVDGNGSVDLSGRTGTVTVTFAVSK